MAVKKYGSKNVELRGESSNQSKEDVLYGMSVDDFVKYADELGNRRGEDYE